MRLAGSARIHVLVVAHLIRPGEPAEHDDSVVAIGQLQHQRLEHHEVAETVVREHAENAVRHRAARQRDPSNREREK